MLDKVRPVVLAVVLPVLYAFAFGESDIDSTIQHLLAVAAALVTVWVVLTLPTPSSGSGPAESEQADAQDDAQEGDVNTARTAAGSPHPVRHQV